LNAIGKYFEYWKRFTGPDLLLSAVQFHFETGPRPHRLRLGRPTWPISSTRVPRRRSNRVVKLTSSAASRPRQLPLQRAPTASRPPRAAHATAARVHRLVPYPLPLFARCRGKASLAFSSPSQRSAIAIARVRSSTLHRRRPL
jgi:hypothetical protein